MLCCVPNCSSEAARTPQVMFPKQATLRHRWQQLVQQGAGVALAGDQLQEICIKHFADPENYTYQEPVLFTDSAGQPIKLATCRLCQKVQRESSMCQLEMEMAGKSLSAVIFSTLRIRLRPSEFSQRLCQECLVKIDVIYRLQIRYSMLETSYQDMTKMRVSLEVIEPAVMEQDQDVDEVPEDLTEYLEEVCHEEIVGPEVDVQKVLEQIKAANDPGEYDVQLCWEVVPQKKVRRPTKRKPTPVAAPDGAKPRRKYVHSAAYIAKQSAKPPKPQIPRRDTGARTCHVCKKLFPRREDLLDHLLENHATPEGYACAECDGKRFETVILYNTHLKFHDAAERFYKCDFCAMRYCSRSTQHRHENLVHGMTHEIKLLKNPVVKKQRNYQCEQCGKMLPSQYTMDRHMQVHQGAVQCDICNKTVPSTSHLRIHKLRHVNEKPFHCTMCDKRYAGKHALKVHTIKIHEKKQAYQCRICKEAFNSRTEYRHHAWEAHALKYDVHGTRLQFKCLLCPEVPRLMSDLVAHVESTHAGEEYPYKTCELCPDKKFVAATALNLHRHWKHSNYVRPDRRKAAEERRKQKEAAEERRKQEEAAAVQSLQQSPRRQQEDTLNDTQ